MRNPNLQPLQVQIPKALYKKLKKHAASQGDTLSSLTRRLLATFAERV